MTQTAPSIMLVIDAARDEEAALVVAWLREYGNHPPSPNCERCNAADAIAAGQHRVGEVRE